jgi:hypothetical protein
MACGRRILQGEEAMAVTGTMLCLECYEAADISVGKGEPVRVRMSHGAVCGGGAEQD